MKINEITFENFRQFVGTQSISFATSEQQNVTLIYGANGAGKTTILNAFLWAMYGTFSPDLEFPNRLAPNTLYSEAIPGSSLTSSVTLYFEDDDFNYVLRRQAIVVKQGTDQVPQSPTIQLSRIDHTGASKTVPGAHDAMDQILPERLSQFFFFNGERMEKLVTTGFAQIEEAIKTVLGLTKIERSIKHLEKADSSFVKELNKMAGDEKINTLTEARERGLVEQTRSENALNQDEANLRATRETVDAVHQQLREHEASRELQKSRDEKEGLRTESDDRYRNAQSELRKLIGSQGVVALLGQLSARSLKASKELRVRGELPAPIKLQFIDDLLSQGKCICGTELSTGTTAHEHVHSWREKAGLAEAEEAWIRVGAIAERIPNDIETVSSQLRHLNARVSDEAGSRKKLEAQISEIDTKLKGVRVEEVQKLETKRSELEDEIDKFNREIQRHEMALADVRRAVAAATEELQRAKVDGDKAALAQRRMRAVRDAGEVLQKVLEIRTEAIRSLLEERVLETYRQISFKPYTPRLDDKFRLTLHERVGNDELVVARSTGENQVLSLTFVAALAALARDRSHDKGTILGGEGGIFPIVMDAAFASLDDNYRRDISRALPKLAPQIVVMVSKAQGLGVVADELAPYVGSTNVITFHASTEGLETETIELDGRNYDYVRAGSDDDYAKIERVS